MRSRTSRGSILTAASFALVAVSLVQLGCDSPPNSEKELFFSSRFVDLASAQTVLQSSLGEPNRGLYFCDDQTGWGLTLRPGERLEIPLVAAPDATLRVEICARSNESGTGGDGSLGSLALEWHGEAGEKSKTSRLEVPIGRKRWWTFQQPLFPEKGTEETVRATTAVALSIAPLEAAGPGALVIEGNQASNYDLHLEAFVESTEVVAPAPEATRVILISIDTFREDAVAAFGGQYETPYLDQLIADSETFRPHYAAATWTKPSHVSMLTGLPSWMHTVRSPGDSLPAAIETLAERLQKAEVETAGFTFGIPYFDEKSGIAQGFDQWLSVEQSAGRLFRQVSNWLAENRSASFFLFAHTFETHSDFSRLPYEGPGTRQMRVSREFGLTNYGCERVWCASMRLEAMNRGLLSPLIGEAAVLNHLYGQGVEETDRQIGVLLNSLKSMGLYDSSTILVTSDHGEAFLEHGEVMHKGPWEEILRVPLIVKWPAQRNGGHKVQSATASVDLAPTILDLFGIHSKIALGTVPLPGRSLREIDPSRVVFSGTFEVVVRDGAWKAVLGKDVRLFNLEHDPRELVDLSTEEPEIVVQMQALWQKERRKAALFEQELELFGTDSVDEYELTQSERERLRALGYID